MKKKRRLGRGLRSLVADFRGQEDDTVDGNETGFGPENLAPEGISDDRKIDSNSQRETPSPAGSFGGAFSREQPPSHPTAETAPATSIQMPSSIDVAGRSSPYVKDVTSFAGVSDVDDRRRVAGGSVDEPDDMPTKSTSPAPSRASRSEFASDVRHVELDLLRPNRFQPRTSFDVKGVQRLADSIETSGLLQPIVARPTPSGMEIVAGERRWRAAKLAGLKTVPVLVREASDEEMLELSLVENIHREDLNAVDRAAAYRQYCDTLGLTAEEVAGRLGEDRTTVVNYLRLLDLPETVRELLAAGRISMGHARSLAGVRDDARQIELAALVACEELSVRALEDLVRRDKAVRVPSLAKPRVASNAATPAHVRDLERRFEEVLGTKVRILGKPGKSSGRIVIDYYSVDDFERIGKAVGVIREGRWGGVT